MARYGGEEFGLIVPESDAGVLRAALLRNALASVRELGIPHSGSLVANHVTISIGAVTLVPATAGGDWLSTLEAADRLFYDAKHMGRNQARFLDLASGERESVG